MEAPSILEVLTGNKKILFGLALLVLALILAFSAIYKRTKTYSQEGNIGLGETVEIEKKITKQEGELRLKIDEKSTTRSVKINFFGDNNEVVREVYLSSEESKSIKLDGEVSYFKLVSGEGVLYYKYIIKYSYQPLRLLSLPAAILTVFGVIATYRGFDEFMIDFAKMRAKESNENKVLTEREDQHVDFMK